MDRYFDPATSGLRNNHLGTSLSPHSILIPNTQQLAVFFQEQLNASQPTGIQLS